MIATEDITEQDTEQMTCAICEVVRAELARTINEMAEQAEEIVGTAGVRLLIMLSHGAVYNTDELTADFEIVQFAAPLAVVRRRSDGVLGTVFFTNRPRFYYGFQPHVD
jgi:hypothetical protein